MLKGLKLSWFREDLVALLDLLKQQKLKPLVAERFSFVNARQAQEMLVKGGVNSSGEARGAFGC
jgi:hypothetical protein